MKLRSPLLPLAASLLFSALADVCSADSPLPPNGRYLVVANNKPETLLADPRVKLEFGDERLMFEGGLQPSVQITRSGALFAQAQAPKKSPPQKRMTYPSLLVTGLSTDAGRTWKILPVEAGVNAPNLEGGLVQLRNGTLLALDTYITPGPQPGTGVGQLYVSHDDWKTMEGPIEATFNIPHVSFTGSTDDGGRPYEAVRLHRRILELPNGDLLTTVYGIFDGDRTPAHYMRTMMKTRVILMRSTNGGRHWDFVSTVAVDPQVGTEGYDEPAIVRISQGRHAGRLLCLMRTGRELREAWSDDEGRTWSPGQPRVFGDLDVYATKNWADMFRDVKDKKGNLIINNPDEFIGAVVDPDLIELPGGVLAASFGVRIPPRACWPRAGHPWNGNYLALSWDGGETWTHLVRMTSGVLTTHYTALENAPSGSELYYAYDLGDWGSGQGRSSYGRFVKFTFSSKP